MLTWHVFRLVTVWMAGLFYLQPVATAEGQDDVSVMPRWWGLQVEQRTRSEWLTAPVRVQGQGASRTLVTQTRLAFDIRDGLGPFRVGVELQDARDSYTEGLFSFPDDQINKLDILQLRLEIASRRFLGVDLPTRLQLGRLTADLGSRRLVARNVMRNTTNAFDGVLWQLGRSQEWRVHGFATQPVLISTERLDASQQGGAFFGVYYEKRLIERFNLDVYYFGLRDDGRTEPKRSYTTIGGRLYREPTLQIFDWEMEATWQLGRHGGGGHNAFFQHAQLGYTFDTVWETRLSFQYDHASGDDAPADGRFGRFDTLFGARAFEFGPTGIYGPLSRSNLVSPGLRIHTTPEQRVGLTGSYRAAWLAEARDRLIGTGLQDPTGLSGRFLGHYLDTRVQVRPIHEMLVDFGYSWFLKSTYFDTVPFSPGRVLSNYFFAAVSLRLVL